MLLFLQADILDIPQYTHGDVLEMIMKCLMSQFTIMIDAHNRNGEKQTDNIMNNQLNTIKI